MKISAVWKTAGLTAILLIVAAAVTAGETAQFLKTIPQGFTSKEPVAFYNRNNLYEYIDGQAVFYNSYGFTRLEHGVYQKAGGTYTVDVYELKSRLSAFGAFRQQREEDAKNYSAGVEGAIIDYLTVFYKDKYYVEVIPLTGGEDDMDAMKLLAVWVDGILPGEKALPPETALFPPQGLVPHSERYVDESLISYSFMGRGVTALYKEPGQAKELRVFIGLPPDQDKAREIYKGFEGKMTGTSMVIVGDVDGVKGQLPYRGLSLACQMGNYVYGAMGITDEKQAISLLTAIGERLKQFEEKK